MVGAWAGVVVSIRRMFRSFSTQLYCEFRPNLPIWGGSSNRSDTNPSH
jgi:hypothetical protein